MRQVSYRLTPEPRPPFFARPGTIRDGSLSSDVNQGNTWKLKGFQLGRKPKQSFDEFLAKGAANYKKLPPGWKVRVVTLERDLIEIPDNHLATIMTDELFSRVGQDRTGHERQLQAVVTQPQIDRAKGIRAKRTGEMEGHERGDGCRRHCP